MAFMEASIGIMISKVVMAVHRELGKKKKKKVYTCLPWERIDYVSGLIMFQERGKERIWFKSLGDSKKDEKYKLTFMYKIP